uniref:Uncharacterized protein n=1 Tax=Triticum urartu TaxID=4572 RepID=A0A8R7P0Y4_TRIUA
MKICIYRACSGNLQVAGILQGTLKHVVQVNIVRSGKIFAYSGADRKLLVQKHNWYRTAGKASLQSSA